MQKFILRTEITADEIFLRSLYASTRRDELALIPWTDEQKTMFLNQQFDLQRHHYRFYYPDATLSVILIDDIQIGRWYVHRGAECLSLMDISLLPQYRSQGIGRKLLETLQAEARETGKSIRLHVENHNPAQRLYVRLGFVLIEEQGIHRLMEWCPVSI